jgi:3-deoxy-D-manno-octulosonate 8-phosphate phosphatase (KDO 8-P phosphatase)
MILPKLVLTDIDGVWTDGGMYYAEDGVELKKFNTGDSAGVLFLRLLDIPVGIVTGEDTQIVKNRAAKLKIDELHLGVKDKLQVIRKIANSRGITLDDIAYIGDDINDIRTFQHVGFSACPSNAPDYVAKYADVTIANKGGEGAFRAFAELILKENGLLDKALQSYLSALS